VHYHGNLPLPEALCLGTPGRGAAAGITDADLRAAALMMSPAPASPPGAKGARAPRHRWPAACCVQAHDLAAAAAAAPSRRRPARLRRHARQRRAAAAHL
jgi:hypothetical protein